MRVAALYDIHSNPFALDAVLEHAAGASVDLVVAGGDVVARPFPTGTFDRLESLADRRPLVRGSGDRGVVEGIDEHSSCCREQRSARVAVIASCAVRASDPLDAETGAMLLVDPRSAADASAFFEGRRAP